jgi:hypothetical protein
MHLAVGCRMVHLPSIRGAPAAVGRRAGARARPPPLRDLGCGKAESGSPQNSLWAAGVGCATDILPRSDLRSATDATRLIFKQVSSSMDKRDLT